MEETHRKFLKKVDYSWLVIEKWFMCCLVIFHQFLFFPLFFVGELEKSQLTAKEDNEKIRSLEGTMWLKSFLPSVTVVGRAKKSNLHFPTPTPLLILTDNRPLGTNFFLSPA